MPQAGSQIVKSLCARGSGFMQRTMDWISTRGVKYWPAPFFPSLAAFSSRPSKACGLHVHVERGPFGLVDQADQLLEVDRIVEAGLGPGEDVAQDAGLLAQGAEHST